jgi:hypothetical protein
MSKDGSWKAAHAAANMPTGDYADAKPYDRGPLTPWKHSGIRKPSVLDRVSAGLQNIKKFASHLPISSEYWKIRANNKALDEYQKWNIANRKKATKYQATDEQKVARFNEYEASLKGGKNKSRKSRKNRKTRSRKNRKTRSRK